MKYYRYKMNLLTLNIFSIILLIVFLPLLYINLNGTLDFNYIFLILIMLWLILHEIIHYIGFITIKNVKKKNVVFGAELESGIFYCMCKQNINKNGILISAILPLLTIGIITLIISLIINNSLLLVLSIFNIAGAAGDIVMFFDILRMPKDIKYFDLDDPTSFYILSEEDLMTKKYFGLQMIETGKYNETKMKAKDYNKLKITKTSKILLMLVVVIIFLNLIITIL